MKVLIEIDATPQQLQRFLRASCYASVDPRSNDRDRADIAFRQAEATSRATLRLGEPPAALMPAGEPSHRQLTEAGCI